MKHCIVLESLHMMLKKRCHGKGSAGIMIYCIVLKRLHIMLKNIVTERVTQTL